MTPKIRHFTVNWGWHSGGQNRTWYSASVFSRDRRYIIWTTGATTLKPAKCDPYSRAEVFATLRAKLKTLRPGRLVTVTRHIHH